jgi:hypothetical protein
MPSVNLNVPSVELAVAMLPYGLVAVGITVVYLALLRFTKGGKWRPDEPKMIPHWLPFFGHAFRFAINKRTFFLWAE